MTIGASASIVAAFWGEWVYVSVSCLVLVLFALTELGKGRMKGIGTFIANLGTMLSGVALAPFGSSLLLFLSGVVAPNDPTVSERIEGVLDLFAIYGVPAFGVGAVAMIVGSILAPRDRPPA